MLPRVLEPEVMDTPEDAHEYESIDNDDVNAEFVASVLALAPASGRVLDAGTGPGDIAVLLAKRAPGLTVVAIDLAEEMLKLAERRVKIAGLGKRVELARRDVKATGYPAASFDMVVSNSTVHHIPDPGELFAEVRRVARPGAGLFIKDLHRPDSIGEWDALVARHAAGCTAYQRRLFADSLRAALTVAEVIDMAAAAGLTGVEVVKCSDRHWALSRPARGGGDA